MSRSVGRSSVAGYVLGLGDDALVLAQRLCEWVTRAPTIEEDIALANVALDLLGQARLLLTYAGELECEVTGRPGSLGAGSLGSRRSEDDLAFGRDEREFRNCQLVELPNGDFAATMARQLIFSAYQYELYLVLSASSDERISGVAAKAVKEVAYHREHASAWVRRLGDGTGESHARMVAGMDGVWPFAGELFEPTDVGYLVEAGIAVDPVSLHRPWLSYVGSVLGEATLDMPVASWAPTGGRRGLHTESFGYLLAEMQHLHRSHAGATW